MPITDAFDFVADYGYGKSGRFDSLLGGNSGPTDFTNYWQRHLYVGFAGQAALRARRPRPQSLLLRHAGTGRSFSGHPAAWGVPLMDNNVP